MCCIKILQMSEMSTTYQDKWISEYLENELPCIHDFEIDVKDLQESIDENIKNNINSMIYDVFDLEDLTEEWQRDAKYWVISKYVNEMEQMMGEAWEENDEEGFPSICDDGSHEDFSELHDIIKKHYDCQNPGDCQKQSIGRVREMLQRL